MKLKNIITDNFVFGGKCIGKIQGKTVFVPYSVPGETLEIEIIKEHRDFDEARITRIIEPSPHRAKPVCPLYGKCGGCNMMHIGTEHQKTLRKQIMKELFESEKVLLPEIQTISADDFGYRSRIQLNDGGFSERKTNSIVPVENCPVADGIINEWLKENPFPSRPKGRCQIFAHRNLKEKIIVSKNEEKKDSGMFSSLNAEQKKKNRNIKQSRRIYKGTVISEENEANISIAGKEISFDARGFFQSNINVLEKSVREICEGLSGESCLDMYSGCGTFSVFLAERFEKLTLVEHNRDSLVYAEKNLSGKNHISFGLGGAKWVQTNPSERFDAAVIDPPRSGMEKEVLDYFCSSGIPKIRYVSCNPSTQARDISRLLKNGYRIKKAFLLDFYPNTSHIETLVNLEKD